MNNLIVSKFYSNLEKLGIKKHKTSNDEIEFLNKFNEIKQCDILCQEVDFNISRLNIKIKILFVFLVAILGVGFMFFCYNYNFIFFLSIVFSGGLYLWMKKFTNKIDVYRIEKKLLKSSKTSTLQNIFR